MIRQQRPMGLTLLLTSIQKKSSLDDKVIYQLINYILNHNLSWNHKPLTIEVLAELVGISKAQAYKYYLQHNAKVASLISPKDIQGLYLGQIFQVLAGASETLNHSRQQRRVLQASQGNEYVPFLTEQVNSILGTEMTAYEKLSKITESLTKTIDPRAMPTPPEGQQGTEGDKAIGVAEAIRLLESKGQLGLAYANDNLDGLAKQYQLEDGPQVIANLQIGNKEDAALIKKDNKAHHRTRRSRELDLDEEDL